MTITKVLLTLSIAVTVTATACSVGAEAATSASGFIVEHSVSGSPLNIVVEKPGHIWFTLPDENAIGSLVVDDTGQSTFTPYDLPTPNSEPYNLAYASNTIWFTERAGNRIGRLDISTGAIQEYAVPTANSMPAGIAVAPNGQVWFVESKGNKVGRFDPNTEQFIAEYIYWENSSLCGGLSGAHPENIVVQNNNTVWFTLPDKDRVINFTLSTNRSTGLKTDVKPNELLSSTLSLSGGYLGADNSLFVPQVAKTSVPSSTNECFDVGTGTGSRPFGATIDNQGALWITTSGTDLIRRLTPGTLTFWKDYRTPTTGSEPTDITYSTEGNLLRIWFVEHKSGKVGQLTVTATGKTISLLEYTLPSADSQPSGIAVDANGHGWIAESGANKIAEWRPPYFNFVFLPIIFGDVSRSMNTSVPTVQQRGG